MKEMIRQYGGTVITAVVGILLIIVMVSLPVGKIAVQSTVLNSGNQFQEFEIYWKSR